MNIRKKLRLQRRVKMGVVVCSLGFMVSGIIMNITNANFRQTDKPTVIRIVESSQPIQAQTISTQEHTEQYSKLPYPFDTMSLDWSGEQIAGFKEYQIPDDYELYGGYFPLEMQEYTYIICKDYGVDYSLIIAMIWQAVGYYMVMYIAGMDGVPDHLYEAADLEGCGKMRQFFVITMPMTWEVIRTTLTFFIISTINMSFLFVDAMTQGEANSHVLLTYMYKFSKSQYGYAMAIGTVIFVLAYSVSLIIQRLTRREIIEY